MKRAFIFLTLLSCGHATPTFVTAHGLRVFTNDLPEKQAHVEVSTEIFINKLSEHPNYDEHEVRTFLRSGKFNVKVIPEPFKCLPDGTRCAGVATRTSITHVYDQCQPVSSYIHELMHIVQMWLTENDPHHTEEGIWSLPGGVVPTARWQACEFLCPDLCLSGEEKEKEDPRLYADGPHAHIGN